MRKQIERVLADNGIAVCVFDADVTRTLPAEKAKFEDLKRKYADNPAVILCDSMPSIEFWFLLHYLNTNRYFATSDDVIDVLHHYMPNFSKHQSFLSKEAWVSELLADNRLDTIDFIRQVCFYLYYRHSPGGLEDYDKLFFQKVIARYPLKD